MFEITYADNETLECYKDRQQAYKNGIYDFTFEKRFIIYHTPMKYKTRYISLDILTGHASQVKDVNLDFSFNKSNYKDMIKDILYANKYLGNNRYKTLINTEPEEVIDMIFRIILPKYGFGIREEQIALSKKMYHGFTEKQIAICEAEVGTGKTLAYLVAAYAARLYYIKNYNISSPITITTANIELQKNLVKKEIPRLSRMLEDFHLINQPFISILRKGKEHYFCKYRFEELLRDLKQNKSTKTNLIKQLEDIKKLPLGIDLDNYNIKESVKKRICVKNSCLGCKYKDICEYKEMVKRNRKNENIDFQVTNHNLYLTAMKYTDEENMPLLLKSDFVAIDEAHKFRDAAQDVFGEKLSQSDIKTYVTGVKYSVKVKKNAIKYKTILEELLKENNRLFKALEKKWKVGEDESDDKAIIVLTEKIKEILLKLSQLVSQIESLKDKKDANQLITGRAIISAIKTLVKSENNIYWIEKNDNDELILSCTPKNIDNLLFKYVWNRDTSHVLTSGTMKDGENFDYFKRTNGLMNIPKRLLVESATESPFDYENNALLYLPENLPSLDGDQDKYFNEVSEHIYSIIEATHGHTAILFTSYKVLQEVFLKLKDRLTEYETICMSRGNKTAISEFKNAKNGVIFASGSMWEGIDCAGDCLSSVIIVRLPFPRRNAITEEKKSKYSDIPSFIDDYCCPNMIIKLRQGVGRLIRSETDTGVVSILDPRVKNAHYYERVTHALKKFPITDCLDDVKTFISCKKDESYFA